MEKNYYDGIVERWKSDLIVARARRMGFRPDEITDVQQQIIQEVAAFHFAPVKSNGATEATALVALIDNNLKMICRTMARYRVRLDRLREEPIPSPEFEDQEKLLDIRAAVAALPEREQRVCKALGEGYSKHEIAKLLHCGWHTVDRLIRRIRAHFEEIGLDGYLFA